jgi:hypothetical protein
MQRPVFYQIQDRQLELLNLQIEFQKMQNQVLAELTTKRIIQNSAILKHNFEAIQWKDLNKVNRVPPGMYS